MNSKKPLMRPRGKGRNRSGKNRGKKLSIISNVSTINSSRPVGGKQPSNQSIQTKYFDTYIANQNITNVGTLQNLVLPTQGAGVSQRTGDTIFMRKFSINYKVSTQNADLFNTVRVLIFIWFPNSFLVAPTFATLTNGGGTTTTQWMYDWQYSNQFKVLYDRVHALSGLATSPTAAGHQSSSVEIKFRNKRVEFSIGSTSGSQQIWLFTISDSLVAPFPLLEFGSRVAYSDEF